MKRRGRDEERREGDTEEGHGRGERERERGSNKGTTKHTLIIATID